MLFGRNARLFPLFLTIFLDVVGLGIAIPILAVVLLDDAQSILPAATPLGVRTTLYGILIAAFPFAQFFGAPILGALSDRYGRKKILQLSLFGTLIGYVLFAVGIWTRSPLLLIVSRILPGFTGGNISVAQSAIADLSEPSQKTRNFGLIGMAFGLGFILGPYLGGKLADPNILSWFTLATPFLFAALLTGFNMVLLHFLFRESLPPDNRALHLDWMQGIHHLQRAFGPGNLRVIFTIVFLATLGFNFFTQFFQIYLIDKFHFNQGQIGDVFGFIGLCIAVSQGLIVRPIAQRYSPERIAFFMLPLLAISQVLLLVPTNSWWIYAILPFLAIAQGLLLPSVTTIVSNLLSEKEQGEGLGINQSVQSLAMALPPILAGIIAAFGRNLPIIIGSVCIGIAWLMFVFLFSPHSKQK